MMKFWPSRTRKELLRTSALLVLLVFTVWFVSGLRAFNPGLIYFRAMTQVMGGHIFEAFVQNAPHSTSTRFNDPNYGFSVLNQSRIILACEEFVRKRKSVPSLDELVQAGLNPEFSFDPWNRKYRLRLLPGNVLMVQTTGPSGVDNISSEWAASAQHHLKPAFQLVGDNLVVLKSLD